MFSLSIPFFSALGKKEIPLFYFLTDCIFDMLKNGSAGMLRSRRKGSTVQTKVRKHKLGITDVLSIT